MGIEENKALTRRLYLEMNEGNVAALDELLADDYRDVSSAFPQPLDKQAAIAMTHALHAAMPGLHRTLEEQIAEGDRVVDRVTYRGTSTNAFMGVPPTGKTATFSAILIYRIAAGRIAEAISVIDRLSMFQQLGITPPSN